MLLTKPRQTAVRYRIDVTAFAGILLALLFMFLAQPVLQANLCNAVLCPNEKIVYLTQMLDAREASTVAMTRDGPLFFRHSSSTVSELISRLQNAVRNNPEMIVYIKIDRRTHYGSVKQVLNGLQAARIPVVVFSRAY